MFKVSMAPSRIGCATTSDVLATVSSSPVTATAQRGSAGRCRAIQGVLAVQPFGEGTIRDFFVVKSSQATQHTTARDGVFFEWV
jgi:hypothetical protein